MIDLISKRKWFIIISSVLCALTLIGALVLKIDVDITFKGGTLLTYSYEGDVETSAVKSEVESALKGHIVDVSSKVDNSIGKTTLIVSLAANEGISSDEQMAVTDKLQKTFKDNNIVLEQSTVVDPSIGGEFFGKCIVALCFAILVLLIFIGFRFKKIGGWATGITGIIALIHDVVMVFFSLLVFNLPINANVMAVILTILGYSINDSIVIFDRLRENKRYMPKNTTDLELINVSVNQCFKRCIVTSLTTLLTMVVVTVVALVCNVNSITTFSIPMMVGLVSGTYSSICLSVVLWPWLNKILNKKNAK